MLLALEALQKNNKLSLRAASKIHKVSRTTLTMRRDGRPARHDLPANSRKLTDLEEKTIIQYIMELCARAFHPRLCYVEDMANRLLRERDAPPVGISGGKNTSRWGFRGTEDLGDGLKAVWNLEGGILMDTGASVERFMLSPLGLLSLAFMTCANQVAL